MPPHPLVQVRMWRAGEAGGAVMNGTYEIVKDALRRKGSITLALEGYDDIFSDFDPRPYSRRAVSEDFIRECRRATRNRSGEKLELRLALPASGRLPDEEERIRHRLAGYFQKHFKAKGAELFALRRRAWIWTASGAACMMAGAFLSTGTGRGMLGLDDSGFLFHLLLVVIEPASWFLVWEGMELLILGTRDTERESAFFRTLAEARITFQDR